MSFLLLLMAITMFSCTPNDNAADTTATKTEELTVVETLADTELITEALITEDATEEVTEALTTEVVIEELTTEEETTVPLPLPTEVSLPSSYSKANSKYECDDGSVLHTFKRKKATDYAKACDYYSKLGFEVYSSVKQDENLATTFVGKSVMAHVYYTAFSSELNIVLSDTAADTLPPKTPEVTDGNYKCTVTQIMDDENLITCGMGYVIQLEDGSFIIYDGSYATQAAKLIQCILDMHKGEGKPVIRAWLLTHSHNDHYPTFEKIANDEGYRSQISVEHVIVSQLNDEKFNLNNEEIAYLSTKFYDDVALLGSKVVFAHTGMNFTFCNLNMEILYAPESIYKNMNSVGNFNDTSIVSRLYDAGYSAIFTGDIMEGGSDFLLKAYSADYLKSDICQVAHHGVYGASFDYILELYDAVRAPIMFQPASAVLYEHKDVRAFSWAFEEKEYIKEILLQGVGQFTREWGTTIDEDAELSIPNFTPKNPRPN